ncbi:MAG: hypothetical protein ACP5HS_06030, partial [Anaerolineae bacterium]
MVKQAGHWTVWRRWVLSLLLLLGITVVVVAHIRPGPSRDRVRMYGEVVAWLDAYALPEEALAVQDIGALKSLTSRPLIRLPLDQDAAVLLDHLEKAQPDYCLALRSVAWDGVVASPWFFERYERVSATTSAYDSASPLALYRYHPSPFDEGEVRLLDQRLEGEDVGHLSVQTVRLSSQRLTPVSPLYVTAAVSGTVREPLDVVLELRDVVEGGVWSRTVIAEPGGVRTDAWPVSRGVTIRHVLGVPFGLPAGEYVLTLAFVRPNLAPFGQPVELARVHRPPEVARGPLEPDHRLRLTFGGAIDLVGYDAPDRARPGDTLSVALYWHALASIDEELKVFVHLLGPDGTIAAQSDGVPVGWSYPTSAWQVGDYVRDVHVLTLGEEAERGDYGLVVGLYELESRDRWPVRDEAGEAVADSAV